jgi:hypothetical protein
LVILQNYRTIRFGINRKCLRVGGGHGIAQLEGSGSDRQIRQRDARRFVGAVKRGQIGWCLAGNDDALDRERSW